MTSEKDDAELVVNEQLPARTSLPSRQTQEGVQLEDVNLAYESTTEDTTSGDTDNNNAKANVNPNHLTPVYYTSNGGAHFTQENVIVTREDGSRVIISPESQRGTEQQREVKEQDLKFLKIFAVISVVLFLPLGIASVFLAWRTSQEFFKPAETRDKKKIKKMAKRCETCIIFSLVSGLMTLALTFAIVERYVWEHEDDYWDHRFNVLAHAGR